MGLRSQELVVDEGQVSQIVGSPMLGTMPVPASGTTPRRHPKHSYFEMFLGAHATGDWITPDLPEPQVTPSTP